MKIPFKFFATLAAAMILLTACSSPVKEPLWTDDAMLETTAAEDAELVYDGELYQHKYIYENERDRGWEKDIVTLADRYLQEHPKISGRIFYVSRPYEEFPYRITALSDREYNIANVPLCFDEDLQREFISATDALIREIPELTDMQIWYRLIKLTAMLDDIHTTFEFPFYDKMANGIDKEILPLRFEVFYNDNGFEFRAITVPTEQEQLLYAKLTAINGFSVYEAVEILTPYMPADNRYALLDIMSTHMTCLSVLQDAGIVDYGVNTVDFTFELDDGTEVTYTTAAITYNEYIESERIQGSLKARHISPFENTNDTMWYEYRPEDDMLYIRFNSLGNSDGSDSTEWMEFFQSLYDDESMQNGVGKLVVDVRSNNGGQTYNTLNGFIEFLDALKAERKYILIDSSGYSAAVIVPSKLKQGIKGSVLVGTPTCQQPNMYTFSKYDNISASLPVHGLSYTVSDNYLMSWPDYPYDALMPDITVYQTVEDYENGVDTVLEAIKAMND